MISVLLVFALKNILVLLAKLDSGELRCPAAALIKNNCLVGKCYSVVYITMIIVFDQLIRRKLFLFLLIYWNGSKSSLLFHLLVHITYHLIFVSLLFAYIYY